MLRSLLPLLLVFLLGCERGRPQPHVFVFLVDTLRADHLGCYGYDRPTSPALDAFAEDAFVFTEAYSPSPWTRPAIASLFTGLPPQLHGVRGRAGFLPSTAVTWAEQLTARGYHCGAWLTNGHLESRFGLDQGFAEYRFEELQGKAYVPAPELLGRWRASLERQPVDRPVFHYLHFMDPHRPYAPQREYRAPFVRQNEPELEWYTREEPPVWRVRFYLNTYDAEIRQVDASFGDFLETLSEQGWLEDAWVVFLSDHGEEFFEHGVYGHGHGLWENLLRVPLVVRPPGGRDGPYASRLRGLENAPVPIHALADLIDGPESSGLGLANAAAFNLVVPPETIPTPDAPVPRLRRASFTLDGAAGMAIAQGDEKLTWSESPVAGWFGSDLAADPAEWHDSGARPQYLIDELELWSLLGWRGVRLTNENADTVSVTLRTEPREAMYEVRVPVGQVSSHFALRKRPEVRELEWTAAPGESLVLRIDPGVPLLRLVGESEWGELHGDGLKLEPVGPEEDSDAARPRMDPELEKKLRALGYLN